jgi:hypothetical protein
VGQAQAALMAAQLGMSAIQGLNSKGAGQAAAATGERQLEANELFANQLGDGSMGAFNTAIGGLTGLLDGSSPQMFNFIDLPNLQDLAMDAALGFGDRARTTAQEQMALGFNQQSDTLDAALASRGLSRNSGVAAGALTSLLGQQGQQMSELNRGLADQQGNMALQAGQFDAQNALGLGQLNLGGFNAQAAALGQLGQFGMGGINSLLANQQANMGRTQQAATSAGGGKGAAMGGMGKGLMQAANMAAPQDVS